MNIITLQEPEGSIVAEDIRWQQRYQNFDRALLLLQELLSYDIDELKPLEQEGFAQRFEYTFELAWKTARDYLEHSGHVVAQASPRSVIKEAFATGIIEDGQQFIDMMATRNLLSHTYDFTKFKEILKNIKSEYLPALAKFHCYLSKRIR